MFRQTSTTAPSSCTLDVCVAHAQSTAVGQTGSVFDGNAVWAYDVWHTAKLSAFCINPGSQSLARTVIFVTGANRSASLCRTSWYCWKNSSADSHSRCFVVSHSSDCCSSVRNSSTSSYFQLLISLLIVTGGGRSRGSCHGSKLWSDNISGGCMIRLSIDWSDLVMIKSGMTCWLCRNVLNTIKTCEQFV